MTASFRALGTTATVVVKGDATALAVARAAVEDELDAFDRACSRFRADSELTRLNAAPAAPAAVGPLLLEARERRPRCRPDDRGLVDPTVGRTLRLAGTTRRSPSSRPGTADAFRARFVRGGGLGDRGGRREARHRRDPRGRRARSRRDRRRRSPPTVPRAQPRRAAACGRSRLARRRPRRRGRGAAAGWPVGIADDHAAPLDALAPDRRGRRRRPRDVVDDRPPLAERRPRAASHHRPAHRPAGGHAVADRERRCRVVRRREHREHRRDRPRRRRDPRGSSGSRCRHVSSPCAAPSCPSAAGRSTKRTRHDGRRRRRRRPAHSGTRRAAPASSRCFCSRRSSRSASPARSGCAARAGRDSSSSGCTATSRCSPSSSSPLHIGTTVLDGFAPIRLHRRRRPLRVRVPAGLARARRSRLRPAARPDGDEHAAVAHRLPLLAGAPLARVRVVAGRARARARNRQRCTRSAGSRRSRSARPSASPRRSSCVVRSATGSTALRLGSTALVVLVPLGTLVWYRTGPGRHGWAARAGTPRRSSRRQPSRACARYARGRDPPRAALHRRASRQPEPDAAGQLDSSCSWTSAAGRAAAHAVSSGCGFRARRPARAAWR